MATFLHSVPAGTQGVVISLDDQHAHTKELRRLGLHEGSLVEVLSGSDPVILKCRHSKFAVRRESLASVQITIHHTHKKRQPKPLLKLLFQPAASPTSK